MNSFQKDFPKTYSWLNEEKIIYPLNERFGISKILRFFKSSSKSSNYTRRLGFERKAKILDREFDACEQLKSTNLIYICQEKINIKLAQNAINLTNLIDCSEYAANSVKCEKMKIEIIKNLKKHQQEAQQEIKKLKLEK